MDIMKRKETDVEEGGWRTVGGMEIQSEVHHVSTSRTSVRHIILLWGP